MTHLLLLLLLYGGRIQGSAALMHCGLTGAYCAPLDLVPPRHLQRRSTSNDVRDLCYRGREVWAKKWPIQFCVQHTTSTVSVRIFYMPQSYDMGQTALLPLRRKASWGFFQPGLNPRTWVPEASMLTTRPLKPPTLECNQTQMHHRDWLTNFIHPVHLQFTVMRCFIFCLIWFYFFLVCLRDTGASQSSNNFKVSCTVVPTPIAVPLDYRRCVLKVASGLRGSRLAHALFILHSRETLTREENGVGKGG
jgi:hypothetical protein